MAHLWTRDEDGAWAVLPLASRLLALTGGPHGGLRAMRDQFHADLIPSTYVLVAKLNKNAVLLGPGKALSGPRSQSNRVSAIIGTTPK